MATVAMFTAHPFEMLAGVLIGFTFVAIICIGIYELNR